MNEMLAPLFYVFKNDPDEENAVSIYPWSLKMYYCFLRWLGQDMLHNVKYSFAVNIKKMKIYEMLNMTMEVLTGFLI